MNYTYGVLSGGKSFNEGAVGYRYSDVAPTVSQTALVSKLLPYDNSVLPIAIDFYLKLLKCSSFWSKYEPKYDPRNTYSTVVVKDYSAIAAPTLYEDMEKWDAIAAPTHPDFPYSKNDPLLYRVCLKLFSLLASGQPDV